MVSEQDDADEAVAARLFGAVRPKERTGRYQPDHRKVRAVRVSDHECVMAAICTGCKSLFRMTGSGVEEVAELLRVPVPQPTTDYFILFDGCPQCARGTDTVSFVKYDAAE